MQINIEQKRYLITVVVLILILSLISFWRKSSFLYRDKTDYAKLQQQNQLDMVAYTKYLDTLKVDTKASQELFQQLLSQEDVKKEVEAQLQTSQTVTPPEVSSKELNISQKTGQQAVVDYLTNSVGPTVSFNQQTQGFNKALFSSDTQSVDAAISAGQNLINELKAVEVPPEAAALQKALLSSLRSYQDLMRISREFAGNSDSSPWAKVYHDYAAINDRALVYKQEFQKLDAKYQLASLPPLHYSERKGDSVPFVKTADAIFGLGDITITVGDIPRLIFDGIKEGLTASFSQFMGSFIQKMVQKIESNYIISNFLYYSDALVSGQYVDDYLDKYVADNLDRKLIRTFIPQFNCGIQPQNLKPVFQAKAREFLGFDPQSVDPKDPDYYQKMAKVGNFMASEEGWRLYYAGLAEQAKSEAEKAAEKELSSPGYKTPRDTINNKINLSISGIVGAQYATLNAIMQLGISNAQSLVSGLVAQLTQSLMNNFVFRGVTSSGTVGVLKEQPTCLSAAQVQLVLPATGTKYMEPPPPPKEEDLLQEYCVKYPEACPPPSVNSTSPRGEQ